MQVVGISDFNLGDIIRPEPPRLRKVLSGIINFMKFREDKMDVYEKYDVEIVSFSLKDDPTSYLSFFWNQKVLIQIIFI